MVGTRSDYSEDIVEAARSVMLELVHLLGEYRDNIVVVGGWVPELLMPTADPRHIGSIDVDLALNHHEVGDEGYHTIRELLIGRGYEPGRQPFIFHRTVIVNDRPIRVEVDFLAGEYGGTGSRHRTQGVQDVRARKARGCDLAIEINAPVSIEGVLPGGGKDSAVVRVAGIVAFIIMKTMAFCDRLKPKDAWDIYYCFKNYPGGLDALLDEFMPHARHGLVREGLMKLREKFGSPKHVGPKYVADFEELTDAGERELRERDAFERVSYVIERLVDS